MQIGIQPLLVATLERNIIKEFRRARSRMAACLCYLVFLSSSRHVDQAQNTSILHVYDWQEMLISSILRCGQKKKFRDIWNSLHQHKWNPVTTSTQKKFSSSSCSFNEALCLFNVTRMGRSIWLSYADFVCGWGNWKTCFVCLSSGNVAECRRHRFLLNFSYPTTLAVVSSTMNTLKNNEQHSDYVSFR